MGFFDLFRTEKHEKLSPRLKEIEDSMDRLERTVKGLKLEWEESYDKLHHLMARVTKRAQNASSSAAPEAPGNENGTPPSPPPSLLGTHQRLQQMRARHGLLPR